MKLTIPGIMITALLAASPAFAQYQSTGNASTPGASVAKDDTTNVTKQSKKHMASHKQKKHMASHKKQHHAKAMNSKAMKSKAQTTGSGSSSAPGGVNKDDTTPKTR
jgi:hypothetical protein